jgi:hypothetical protein
MENCRGFSRLSAMPNGSGTVFVAGGTGYMGRPLVSALPRPRPVGSRSRAFRLAGETSSRNGPDNRRRPGGRILPRIHFAR